ncbi:MAG: 1-phosphofructokinase family hexose kinase [Chloroflexota bacterium]|nr:MAG: 1-phosphofructokinase family hexose kinase [Chloroflexota bacterium]
MIVTLTPSTAIDYTLKTRSFELNATIRADECAWGMGGKPTDAAWILGKLGVPSKALGFAGGANGRRMEAMLRERGVETDFIWTTGETRLNIVVTCSDEGQSTFTSPGLSVSADELEDLYRRYRQALEGATCVVMGGTLPEGVPPEFYNQAISMARALHLPVIFDSSGPALISGVKARPTLIKPNLDELTGLLGYRPESPDEIRQAAATLQAEYGCSVIVTLGQDGALACLGERIYSIRPVQVPVASAAGAGDGVLAGMALAYSRGEPLENGLRYGFALAGAIVQTLPTADFNLEDYEILLPQIDIILLK